MKTHTSGRAQSQSVVATTVEIGTSPTVTSYEMVSGVGGRKEQHVTIQQIGGGGPTIIQVIGLTVSLYVELILTFLRLIAKIV